MKQQRPLRRVPYYYEKKGMGHDYDAVYERQQKRDSIIIMVLVLLFMILVAGLLLWWLL